MGFDRFQTSSAPKHVLAVAAVVVCAPHASALRSPRMVMCAQSASVRHPLHGGRPSARTLAQIIALGELPACNIAVDNITTELEELVTAKLEEVKRKAM